MSKVMNAVQVAEAERNAGTARRGEGQPPALWEAAKRTEESIMQWSARPARSPMTNGAAPDIFVPQQLEQVIARCQEQITACEREAAGRAAQLESLKAHMEEASQALSAAESAREAQSKRLAELEGCRSLAGEITRAEEQVNAMRSRLRQVLQQANVEAETHGS